MSTSTQSPQDRRVQTYVAVARIMEANRDQLARDMVGTLLSVTQRMDEIDHSNIYSMDALKGTNRSVSPSPGNVAAKIAQKTAEIDQSIAYFEAMADNPSQTLAESFTHHSTGQVAMSHLIMQRQRELRQFASSPQNDKQTQVIHTLKSLVEEVRTGDPKDFKNRHQKLREVQGVAKPKPSDLFGKHVRQFAAELIVFNSLNREQSELNRSR